MAIYLITGGAGFIGSNIVKKLLELGESVRVIDNFSTGKKENIKEFIENSNFKLTEGDLTNLDVCREAVKGVDFILHQAAIPSVPRSISNPLVSNNANIVGTLNLLVAARDQGIKKLVYASSSSIYGDSSILPKKEDLPINPISPYSLTKYAGEKYCQIFYKIYNLPTICLRYFNVFGPNQDPQSQYSAVIPKFITILSNKEKPIIYGDGTQSRDFTFVGNVVEANLLAVHSDKGLGEVFNIACGEQTSLNQLAQLIGEITGSDVNPKYTERPPGDILHSRADISKARENFNYYPKIKLKEGLVKTVDWLKKNEQGEQS